MLQFFERLLLTSLKVAIDDSHGHTMTSEQTILMKYHALFVILKKQQNLKLSCAANSRCPFMG